MAQLTRRQDPALAALVSWAVGDTDVAPVDAADHVAIDAVLDSLLEPRGDHIILLGYLADSTARGESRVAYSIGQRLRRRLAERAAQSPEQRALVGRALRDPLLLSFAFEAMRRECRSLTQIDGFMREMAALNALRCHQPAAAPLLGGMPPESYWGWALEACRPTTRGGRRVSVLEDDPAFLRALLCRAILAGVTTDTLVARPVMSTERSSPGGLESFGDLLGEFAGADALDEFSLLRAARTVRRHTARLRA